MATCYLLRSQFIRGSLFQVLPRPNAFVEFRDYGKAAGMGPYYAA